VTNTVDFSLLASSGARLRSFKAGETIVKEGDRGDEMFVVHSGQVEIRRGNRVLETVPEKGIFGEMALIDDGPRSATVVAKTDVSVVPVSEKQFLFLVRETPFFALNVMRTLVRRLRASNEAV
jgi:CRP/FNR family transcriptional regulator, cyclic AMP receptor protein